MTQRFPTFLRRLGGSLVLACLMPSARAWAQDWGAPILLEARPSHYLRFPGPHVVLNDQGAALAVFQVADEHGRNQVFGAARRPGSGPAADHWQPAVRLSQGDPGGQRVALSDDGTGMAVWSQPDGIWAAPFQAGAWGAPVQVGTEGQDPRIGMDAAGRALVLWAVNHPDDPDFAPYDLVARYEPGSGWGAPAQLGGDTGECSQLAVAPDGHALLSFRRDNQVWSRAFDPAGGDWGEPVPFHDAHVWTSSRWLRDTLRVALGLGPGGHGVALVLDRLSTPFGDPLKNPHGHELLGYDFGTRTATRLDRALPSRTPEALSVRVDGSDRATCGWVLGTPKVARLQAGCWGTPVALGVAGGLPDVELGFSLAVAPGGAVLAAYPQTREPEPLLSPIWSQVFWPGAAARDRNLPPGWQPAVRMSEEQPDTCRRYVSRFPALAMNDWMAVGVYLWAPSDYWFMAVEWPMASAPMCQRAMPRRPTR